MTAPAIQHSARSQALSELAGAVRSPVSFSRKLLKHDTWSMQDAILEAIAVHKRVAVKACHSSSKTFTAADAVLWWITRYPDGIVVTTAPTWTQVEKLLWGYVHQAIAGAVIAFPMASKTEITLGPGNYAMGLSTNEGARFQGWHGHILVIVDEAVGVKSYIFEGIEGIRSGGIVHVLLLANPTVASGYFYDAFNANRARWVCFTISAFDTPNLAGIYLDTGTEILGDPNGRDLLLMSDEELLTNSRPYLTTREWVKEKWIEWGRVRNPMWDAKVLGRFPKNADDQLIWLDWLEASKIDKDVGERDPISVGIDVAGPGEAETVVYVLKAGQVLGMGTWIGPDPRGDVLAFLAPWKDQIVRNGIINIDSAGLGWYFYLHLNDHGYKGHTRPINVGVPSHQPRKYKLLKAELYWSLRAQIQAAMLGGLVDDTTIGQLTSIKYWHTPAGQVEIESKDDARKRHVPSPDRAEALMLAVAPRPIDTAPKKFPKARR